MSSYAVIVAFDYQCNVGFDYASFTELAINDKHEFTRPGNL
jgi:hypothetical protein